MLVVLLLNHPMIIIYYIERLAVNPNHRHHGFGDRLLNHAFDYIKGNEGTVASIGLMDNNTVLKELYKIKGFIETGTSTTL